LETAPAKAAAPTPPAPGAAQPAATEPVAAQAASALMPSLFVAYLFDDVHLDFGDLAQVRNAAERHFNDALTPADRAAIFTTSGRATQDFTDDRVKLHEALVSLRPNPIARSQTQECPDISYYQADLIANKNDPNALLAAGFDALSCLSLPSNEPGSMQQAQQVARSVAMRVLNSGDTESRLSLGVIRDVVRRLSGMPGQRSIILVSPGFLTNFDLFQDKADIMDRAIRANVIISSLNARGLYTVTPGGDASRPEPQSIPSVALKSSYASASALANEDVLAELADGTGGTYFHNNNDLMAGFKQVAARPEYVYVLGFSPQNLKLDGSFHGLKVTLRDSRKVNLVARRGYYAPKHLADPEETAKEELRDALFSREELRDIPVEVRTQFFKPNLDSAKLAVMAKVDIRPLRFKKENGRNRDDLTIIYGLFDRNGNLVTAASKTIEMRLLDQTLATRLTSGITVRNSFDLKPGDYVIRLVMRDSEGQLMAAANGAVQIPMN
jgi:VWFA-related protein